MSMKENALCNVLEVETRVYENHSQDTRYRDLGEVCQTVSATYGMGGNNQPLVVKTVYDASRRHNYEPFGDICETVQAHYGTGGGNVPMVLNEPITYRGDAITSPYTASNPKAGDPCHTLIDDGRNYVVGENAEAIVRRLTPMECERLQGYPDHWTDIGEWTDSKGKKHKDADSPRYKALGNSIALPFWEWMAERMLKELGEEHPTMASLFDGIGGFPLVFSRHGCEPVWASEIEEFPIAVTKLRFPEADDERS